MPDDLDTTLSSDGLTAPTDCSRIHSAVTQRPESEPQDLDVPDYPSRDKSFQVQEMGRNSAPLEKLRRQARTRFVMRFNVEQTVHNKVTHENARIVRTQAATDAAAARRSASC